MKATTVSSKGQITIPADLIRRLNLTPGSKLLVVPVEGGVLLLRRPDSLADSLAGSVSGVFGDARDYVEHERSAWD
jgi:AbrB family looped-hinge helix DNA binding protein